MTNRKITNKETLDFKPFDRYGKVIQGMSWHKISYDDSSQTGSYISKLEPGTETIPHRHTGNEEFYIIEGELIDSDGTIFKKGDFVSFESGSEHNSYTRTGCMILTFMGGKNEIISDDDNQTIPSCKTNRYDE